ncbi:holo-ACP synthase [Meiothermus taiwanensis]|jgi:holo-[acyl-carrier protein] synthase|uniref:Holo-[acyl-carrier-protein] synthase n=1 Tax=Meiothermus taiwanensis WR-220 TaxID=1339250 RepID=A0ABN5LXC9_9DEIN|nr:holo-ACP synthase [Meiothermus taiwanensis]AWR86907.1 holo-acyl-carrier-protein synthase [Meiothermus taiwanensis WR-220]KIQ55187.1 4'-phosphopantetheinyl transferase [Meiothermus taiwanensis]KZK15825.1 4'-phosphopantetheinyl transferase [Meiothermus taiwanensis]
MSIVAIGTDIVELARLRKVWQRHPRRFLERHFVPGEIQYCLAKPDPVPSLAARFAAKEAFQKCWPDSFGWLEVWVEVEGRRPLLHFAPKLRARMEAEHLKAHLSLTHEKHYALAMVVLERQGG